jgi:hypothetical protein
MAGRDRLHVVGLPVFSEGCATITIDATGIRQFIDT